MSETQGITSSIADEVVVGEQAENLILTDEDNQLHAAVRLPAEEVVTKDNDSFMQDIVLTSDTMQNVRDTGNLQDKEMIVTNDQTMKTKQEEVIKKSDSGECRNILPILVEHLRSALALSTINQKPCIMGDMLLSEGLTTKLSSGHSNSQRTKEDSIKSLQSSLNKMDCDFFQDLLLADIKTALVHLQNVLCRIDVDALCRYSSSLEPNDKLHLLQMISNLVTNLRMVKLEDVPHSSSPTTTIKHHARGRDRHTIGVSSEELASARKWLEGRGPSVNAPTALPSVSSIITEPQSVIIPQGKDTCSSVIENAKEQTFDSLKACNKHMKDAINQQQSLQNRSRDAEVSSPSITIPDSKMTANISNTGRLSERVDTSILSSTTPVAVFINKSCNKFTAKKSKIKRANTIDIPNYLKLQVESDTQSSSFGLRRPIDISDRLSWNPPQMINMTIPSFEPKTENDRKFLALINRNNGTNGSDISGSQSPFKSFNYRQTSFIADKNWKSRFSNIKTTFDKSSPSAPSANSDSSDRKFRDDNQPLNEHYSKERDKERAAVMSTFTLAPSTYVSFVSQNNSLSPKFPIFTHAVTSPFQKIETCQKKISHQGNPLSSTSYLPSCASSGMLRAKLKMFDHQERVDFPSSTVKNEYPRINFPQNTKKVIHSDSNLKHIQQTNTRNYNNSFNRSFNDYYSRRNTVSHDDMVQLNKREKDTQRRQSVAVQTINPPIEVEEHALKLNRHESLEMLRQHDSHSNQQIYSPSILPPSSSSLSSSSSLAMKPPPPLPVPLSLALPPIESTPSHSENGNLLCIPPNETDPTYGHVLVNDSPHIITDSIADKCCDLYAYMDDDNNNNDDDDDNNHNNNNNNKNYNKIGAISNSGDNSFINDENIENQDISNDGIVTRYTSAIVTVGKSPSPSRTFPPISSTNCSHKESLVSIRPLFPSSNNVQQHNMLQQSIIRQLQFQDDDQQRRNRIIKPSHRYSTARFEKEYNSPSFEPLIVSPASIKDHQEPCGPLIESNNTQEKINLFEGKLVGWNDCRIEKPVPPIQSRIWPAVPDELSSKINITNPSCSKSWPQSHVCPQNICPSLIPFKYQIGPGDSSDEYLVSCASRPHRSIVLSKSESWHQLAMSKSHLQVPQYMQQQSQEKSPPKITSYSPKHLDGTLSDKLKKMEEKVQRYFHNGCNVSTTPHQKIEESANQGARRSFLPRKNQGALTRSHTMPHIYDEMTDIDKQFDSLFEEATHDNRN